MPKDVDLWKLFEKIEPASVGNEVLSGHHLPGRKADYITRGAAGEPVFLIRSHTEGPRRVPVRLRHLEVEYQIRCRVRDESGHADVGSFVKIACTDDKPLLYSFFISGGEAILRTLPTAPKEKEIYQCVESFAELFSALARPSSRSIKGLWAELLVIQLANDCASMVRAWHMDPDERFDFSNGAIHLEVKASESAQRVHEFSISQLRSPGRSTIFVASVLLQKSAGGIGILGLTKRIEKKLLGSSELIPKLWRNIAQCLGEDFAAGLDTKFDEEISSGSVRLVSASDVPCIAMPLPADILDARLKISLANVVRTKAVEWKDVQRQFV